MSTLWRSWPLLWGKRELMWRIYPGQCLRNNKMLNSFSSHSHNLMTIPYIFSQLFSLLLPKSYMHTWNFLNSKWLEYERPSLPECLLSLKSIKQSFNIKNWGVCHCSISPTTQIMHNQGSTMGYSFEVLCKDFGFYSETRDSNFEESIQVNVLKMMKCLPPFQSPRLLTLWIWLHTVICFEYFGLKTLG